MPKQLPMMLYLVFVFNLSTLNAGSQTANPTASSDSGHVAYTAEFKTSFERRLPDGTRVKVKTDSTEVDMFDSHGRHRIAVTETDIAGRQTTNVQISDPVSHTLKYWSVPGTTAQLVHAPDVGEETDCSRKMKSIDQLHPVSMETTRGGRLPIKDLGTTTILGIQAKGGEITFTPTFIPPGAAGPVQRTNQVWNATDPTLDGLVVRSLSRTSGSELSSRELVKLVRGEPDPNAFEIPKGRKVTARDGRAYYCDIKLGLPAASDRAK